MTELTLTKSLPPEADTVVVGLVEDNDRTMLVGWPADRSKAFAKRHGQSLLATAELIGANPKANTVALVPDGDTRIVVVGLGESPVAAEAARQATGFAVRAAVGSKARPVRHVAVSLAPTTADDVKAVAEGALLAAYRPTPISSRPQPDGIAQVSVVADGGPAAQRAATLARATVTAVNRARDLVNRPANLLPPAELAATAQHLAADAHVAVEVLDETALAAGGFGGLLAVGSGSARPPRLVKLTWTPRGAHTHVALVGKGITFDSGGLDLKPATSMATMGSDMAGAACCLAATLAAADLGLKVKVTTWLALAENLPSGSAYRAGDVLTIRGGVTVENYNTDAEGRLVLADALARAAEDKPDLLVDVATLTGAKTVALGKWTNAVMASDDTVADELLTAAEAAGEAFWHLPLTPEAEDGLKSTVADLKSGGPREAAPLVAAAFLRHFTADLPWAHLDIAGSELNTGEAQGIRPVGATGAGVRTLVALLANLGS